MIDITRIDYRIQGFKKLKLNNNLGDRSTVEYYKDLNGENYEGLKVRETRTHSRNALGIPTSTTVVIDWFGSDKAAPRATKTLIKPLDFDDGLKVNEQSRGRLLNKAKGAAIQLIGLQGGKNFMKTVAQEISLYKEGERDELITAINASAQDSNFKTALISILDVSYIPQA